MEEAFPAWDKGTGKGSTDSSKDEHEDEELPGGEGRGNGWEGEVRIQRLGFRVLQEALHRVVGLQEEALAFQACAAAAAFGATVADAVAVAGAGAVVVAAEDAAVAWDGWGCLLQEKLRRLQEYQWVCLKVTPECLLD